MPLREKSYEKRFTNDDWVVWDCCWDSVVEFQKKGIEIRAAL
jgi:hypothetical protein